METAPTSPIILQADQEHAPLQTAVIFIILIAIYIGYYIMRGLFTLAGNTADYIYFLSCLGSLPIGLGISWFIEQRLKRIWPSGNSLTIDETAIQLNSQEQEPQAIQWQSPFTITNWHFKLTGYIRGGRERRIPNRWLCLACQLRQEEKRIIIYTFLSPKKAASWLTAEAFHEIRATDIYSHTVRDRFTVPIRPELPKELLAGKDGPYWLAERRRWAEGVELTPHDFATFMNYLRQKI